MKRLTMTLVAAMLITLTSCDKEEITPAKSDLKANPIECRKCTETWDISEPIPPSNPQ